MYLSSNADQNDRKWSTNESYMKLFQKLVLTSKTFQISFEIHEDIWQHFPMPLTFFSKGTKNASIFVQNMFLILERKRQGIVLRLISTNYYQPL